MGQVVGTSANIATGLLVFCLAFIRSVIHGVNCSREASAPEQICVKICVKRAAWQPAYLNIHRAAKFHTLSHTRMWSNHFWIINCLVWLDGVSWRVGRVQSLTSTTVEKTVLLSWCLFIIGDTVWPARISFNICSPFPRINVFIFCRVRSGQTWSD